MYFTLFSTKHGMKVDRNFLRQAFVARKAYRANHRDLDHLNNLNGQTCVHPNLDPYHPSVIGFFHDVPNVKCPVQENWVYVDNGTIKISEAAKKQHGDITCEYIPLIRGTDDFSVLERTHIKPMKDNTPLVTDFFKVRCTATDGNFYSNLHSGIAYNKDLHQRHTKVPLPKDSLGLNVLMFGFDSVSRMTWLRKLRKTQDYFVNVLKGEMLKGYNIVGDGTPQALLPILTGMTEPELPEARRGKANAKPVDGHPWIWNDFKKAGYVTQWVEDMASIGTFHYRMLGFKNQPTDHNMRVFYMEAEKLYRKNPAYCLGSMSRHRNLMNWVRDFYHMYPNQPKFSFGFHSEFSHGDSNELQKADDDLYEMLHSLETGGHLNNTVLILMSDHGARFHQVRTTVQGKLEERMPYFAFRFPPWFKTKYPQLYKNFNTNTQRLVTPFDIHETFEDIIKFSGTKVADVNRRGISLFREIPKSRSCAHAGVEPHWCACLSWVKVQHGDDKAQRAIQALVDSINKITESFRNNCEELSLSNITRVVKYGQNTQVLRFKSSADHDGRVADLSDGMKATEDLYQVTINTTPGNGHFEATVRFLIAEDRFVVNDKEISRINKYGNAPHCVAKNYPHLRAYCYCASQLA